MKNGFRPKTENENPETLQYNLSGFSCPLPEKISAVLHQFTLHPLSTKYRRLSIPYANPYFG